MSAAAVALLLGALLALLIRTGAVRAGGALVAVVFGLVLGSTAAGPVLGDLLDRAGTAAWSTLLSM